MDPVTHARLDDARAAGEATEIAGNVTGDVYAFGSTITITGTIERDLIAVGQRIVIDGNVRSINLAAENIDEVGVFEEGFCWPFTTRDAEFLLKVAHKWLGQAGRVNRSAPLGGNVASPSQKASPR